MVFLRGPHLKAILEHCRQKYPLEACGLLTEHKGKVEQVYPVKHRQNITNYYDEYII